MHRLIVFAIVLFCGSAHAAHPAAPPVAQPARQWFEGGTLHRAATMAEWRQASYEIQLATAAQFVTFKLKEIDGIEVPVEAIDLIRPLAEDLVNGINAAGHGGIVDTRPVIETVVAIYAIKGELVPKKNGKNQAAKVAPKGKQQILDKAERQRLASARSAAIRQQGAQRRIAIREAAKAQLGAGLRAALEAPKENERKINNARYGLP